MRPGPPGVQGPGGGSPRAPGEDPPPATRLRRSGGPGGAPGAGRRTPLRARRRPCRFWSNPDPKRSLAQCRRGGVVRRPLLLLRATPRIRPWERARGGRGESRGQGWADDGRLQSEHKIGQPTSPMCTTLMVFFCNFSYFTVWRII